MNLKKLIKVSLPLIALTFISACSNVKDTNLKIKTTNIDIISELKTFESYNKSLADDVYSLSFLEFKTKKEFNTDEKPTSFLVFNKSNFEDYIKKSDIKDAILKSKNFSYCKLEENCYFKTEVKHSFINSINIKTDEKGKIIKEKEIGSVSDVKEISFKITKENETSKKITIGLYNSNLISIDKIEVNKEDYIESPLLSQNSFNSTMLYKDELYIIATQLDEKSENKERNVIIIKIK